MPTVGEQLKAAREAQKLTVTQLADVTKIRSDHIRAIDAGDYDVFSAPVYIRGFVRTYAMALKLEPAEIFGRAAHVLEPALHAASIPQTHPAGNGEAVMIALVQGCIKLRIGPRTVPVRST